MEVDTVNAEGVGEAVSGERGLLDEPVDGTWTDVEDSRDILNGIVVRQERSPPIKKEQTKLRRT